MDSFEEQGRDNSFLQNLSQSSPDPSTYVREYGNNVEAVGGDYANSSKQTLQNKVMDTELLQRLSDASIKDSFQHLKNSQSLAELYNISLPQWTQNFSIKGGSFQVDGTKLVEKKNEFIDDDTNEEKKTIVRTAEEIAKIIANPVPGVKRKTPMEDKEENNTNNLSAETAEEEITVIDDQDESVAEIEKCIKNSTIDSQKVSCKTKVGVKPDDIKHDKRKNSMKKKKKEGEYVPKLIPINWSDPRSDAEFRKEMADFMNCDTFNITPSHLSQPPSELDDMAENLALPTFPRDIIKILSATDEELADWEYSIKIEKGEATEEEDDSELEEMEKELRAIKTTEKFKQLKEKQESERKKNMPVVHGPIDVSEFFKVVMPPNLEEIVAKRDDEGNIISYEPVLRDEEDVIREFERLHLGLESDTEEEEPEDDPKDKILEIDWESEKVKIKSNKLLGMSKENIPECELKDKLEEIEEYIESVKNDNAIPVDPEFEKKMKSVDRLLDSFGFPRQIEIKANSLEEYLEADQKQFDFLFQAHEGKICPPGNLISEIKPGDADFDFILEQELSKPEEEIIKRPSNLLLCMPDGSSESEEELPEGAASSSIKTEELNKISKEPSSIFQKSDYSVLWDNDFQEEEEEEEKVEEEDEVEDEDKDKEEEEEEGDDDTEEHSQSESQGNHQEQRTEESEQQLDDEFKKEYFKRGGTLEGLGELSNPEPSLKLESLESYSKKFLTYPYISEHSGHFNFVRMRRVMATTFPEFADEIFSDLSKIKEFQSPELESSSESDSADDMQIFFKPEPFKTEDLLVKQPEEDSDDDARELPSADEDESSDPNEPISKPVEELSQPTINLKHKRNRVKKLSISSETSSSDSEKLETNVTAEWAPFKTRPIPSEEGLAQNLNSIREILVPKQKKFKIPRKLKECAKGEYTASRDDIKKWKQHYCDYFGDKPTLLKEIINSKAQKAYELFLADKSHLISDSLILNFKKLLEENKIKAEGDNLMSTSITNFSNTECIPPEMTGGQETSIEVDVKTHSFEEEAVELSKDEIDNSTEVAGILKNKLKIDDTVVYTTAADEKDDCVTQEEVKTSLSPKIPVLHLRDVLRPLRKEEWAEEINSNSDIELPGTPAMSYPFELDGFQKHAIQALENGYNVFVSAHTSAGKTVVAEYAIAMSKRNRSKAVYTSPVKALSNQKYADFKRIFGSVGLITGDIQLNENAECLIMTTEILRSMLYNTSEKIRDLEFVVFDEVHYINDPERGHVWEEVLILLPPQVQIVMLSATVPNTLEFANWVGRTKHRKVIVCATQHRPVPLQHYIYTGTGESSPGDTYLVKDGDGPFLVAQYGKAEAAMKAAQEKERKNRKKQQLKRAEEEKEWKRGGSSKPKTFSQHPADINDKRDQTLWISIVSFLQKRDWLPAVVFVFSRKKCDVFAEKLKTIDLTTKSEKSFIHRFIKSQVQKLDDVDQDLPQITVMQSQLLQGIGVHHSGILPVMKEIVEVLFQEGKVKLLFATETFAMGVNMPARTVLFHSIKKFDGNGIRLLLPAEYIQMAGRAGRRGKDSAGNVIILAKPLELIARSDLETLMFGNPSKLISKFRLSYRMILNTLTMSGMLTVQSMMASSYCENQGQLKKKFVEKDLIEAEQFERNLKKKANSDVSDLDIEFMSKFYTYAHAYINKWNELRLQMICHGKILKDLHPGRLLKVCLSQYINRTALLLEVIPHKDPFIRFLYRVLILDQDIQYTRNITSVGMEMDQEQLEEWYRLVSLMQNLPPEKDILLGPNDYSEIIVKPQEIVAVFKENLKLHKNQINEFLLQTNNRPGFRNKISEAGDKIAAQMWSTIGKTTEIDESSHGFEKFELCLSVTEMWTLAEEMKKYEIRYNPLVLNSFKKVFRWKQAEEKVKTLRMCLSDENMILYPDFKNKKALLKEKEYIDDSDSVQIKGYMAARIGKYELIVCELLVENILVNMEAEEVAALLSFLVCRSNNCDHYPISFKTLSPSLQEGIKQCQKIIKDVILLEKQFQIEDYEGSETTKLSFGLVPIMYAWVKQEPFKKIMEMEELQEFEFQEGLLVRWIQQLLETLKEVEVAARVMGDPGVPTKLQAAGQLIKRGIVFAPSLYTTML